MELKDKIYKALERVNDPELHKNLVELNMIEDVSIDGDKVVVNVALTTMGCPLKATMENNIKKELSSIEEISEVNVTFTQMSNEKLNKITQDINKSQNKKEPFKNTKVIAVGSGKGGVGKSTVTANLAVVLKNMGYKVGLIDADILGYSIPQIMGISGVRPMILDENIILPIERNGVKVISMGNLVDKNEALIWRGPILGGILKQFSEDVYWGDLDYMLIDLPPGTGDVPLSLMQQMPKAEILIVTTPQITAATVAKRLGLMAEKTNSKIIGVIENMSYFICDKCGEKHYIFGEGEGEKLSDELGTKFLGQIPLVTSIRVDSDKGVPAVIENESSVAEYYKSIAERLVK